MYTWVGPSNVLETTSCAFLRLVIVNFVLWHRIVVVYHTVIALCGKDGLGDPCATLCNPPLAYAGLWQLHFKFETALEITEQWQGNPYMRTTDCLPCWVCYVRSSEITSEASLLCFIYWRGSYSTHVFFCRCTSCKEVDTSIPVNQGCKEFVNPTRSVLPRCWTSSKFEIFVLVSLLFSTYR